MLTAVVFGGSDDEQIEAMMAYREKHLDITGVIPALAITTVGMRILKKACEGAVLFKKTRQR